MRMTIVFVLSTLLCCASCKVISLDSASSMNQSKKAKGQGFTTDIVTKDANVVDIRARLIKMPQANVKKLRVNGDESLLAAQLLDESNGWITGTRTVYKTTDGGSSWSQVEVPLPQRAIFTDLFFLNRSSGWVLAHECNSDQPCPEDRFWIAHTTDAGATWQLQYEGRRSVGYRIRFYDDQNGWAIGTSYSHAGSPFSPLVLHTADQGVHWEDVSEGILSTLVRDKDKMRSPTHDGAAEMIVSNSSSLALLTGRLRFFSTNDGGQSWAQIAYFGDEPDQTDVRQFSNQNDQYFIVGGAASVEGTWGMFAREQSNGSWQRLRLNGVSFTSLLFLEGDRVLASGSIPTETDSATKRYGLDGVILYSRDGGKNWGIVYRNRDITSINFLTASPAGKVWAVGDGGLILQVNQP